LFFLLALRWIMTVESSRGGETMGTNKTAIAWVLIEPAVPNKKTMKAIRSTRAGEGRSFSTAEELFKDLGI
jgi:hypothetical protein